MGYKDACSRESLTTAYVIDLMEEQKNITQMGGTMRLGAYVSIFNIKQQTPELRQKA